MKNEKTLIWFGRNGSIENLYFGGKDWIKGPAHNDAGDHIGGSSYCFPYGNEGNELFGCSQHGALRFGDATRMKADSSHGAQAFQQEIKYIYNGEVFGVKADYNYLIMPRGIIIRAMLSISHFNSGRLPSNFGMQTYFICPRPDKAVSLAIDTGSIKQSITPETWVGRDHLQMFEINNNSHVEIYIPGNGRINMETEGFSHLVVWCETKDSICIEPIETKPELFKKESGSWIDHHHPKSFQCKFDFTAEKQ